jgi:hypothetical protein
MEKIGKWIVKKKLKKIKTEYIDYLNDDFISFYYF